MSAETKKQVETIKKYFEQVEQGGKQLVKEAGGFDKDLSKKIQKVQEGAKEVVKHIEEKKNG